MDVDAVWVIVRQNKKQKNMLARADIGRKEDSGTTYFYFLWTTFLLLLFSYKWAKLLLLLSFSVWDHFYRLDFIPQENSVNF